ncbi:MAG: hypothetical protein ABL885_11770 [Methylophilaceae bacterium]
MEDQTTVAIEALRKAKTEGFTQDLQDFIIGIQDAELAYRLAHDFHEADLEILEPIILDSDITRYAYEFALIKAERRAGSIELLQEHVIGSGDGGLMLLFAADVEGADTELFEEALENHPDPKFLQHFEHEMRLLGKHY